MTRNFFFFLITFLLLTIFVCIYTKLKFNLVSYNCRGLPKDNKKLDLRPDIQHLFKDNEIICLQETWFAKQVLKYINNLNKPFQGVGVSTTDYSD